MRTFYSMKIILKCIYATTIDTYLCTLLNSPSEDFIQIIIECFYSIFSMLNNVAILIIASGSSLNVRNGCSCYYFDRAEVKRGLRDASSSIHASADHH